jgi:hypothetical protein
MLAAKMDLLLKRLNERAHEKEAMKATVLAMDSQMTCEVYGEIGHSGNDCPETCEEAFYINNVFRQIIIGGTINPAPKEVIIISIQISISINPP